MGDYCRSWLVSGQASLLPNGWTDQALAGSLGGSGAMPQALADGGLPWWGVGGAHRTEGVVRMYRARSM